MPPVVSVRDVITNPPVTALIFNQEKGASILLILLSSTATQDIGSNSSTSEEVADTTSVGPPV